MIDQALFDLRVIEWGSFIPAPFCTKLMADLGAEVIKAPGTGDDSRQYRPFPKDIPDKEKGGIIPISE